MDSPSSAPLKPLSFATRPDFVGFACGVGAGAMWGTALLAPALIAPFTPLQLACARYLAYGAIAFLLLAPRWKRLKRTLTRRDLLRLLKLSLLGNIVYYVLLGTAVQLAGIALSSLIVGFLPVTVTVIGSFDHGAVRLKRLAPSIALSAAGMGCIAWQAWRMAAAPHGHGAALVVGLLCAVGALGCWSAYAVSNTRSLTTLSALTEHDWNMLTGLVTGALAVLLIPPAFLWHTPLGFLSGQALPKTAWLHFLAVSGGVALFASVIGNAFWNRMCRLLPLTLVGQMILFKTLFALLYGFLWEKRLPSLAETLAILLVSASVLTCVHAHRPRAST